jgi:hypothetical protein
MKLELLIRFYFLFGYNTSTFAIIAAMIDEKQVTPEIEHSRSLQEIASDYIVSPTATDDEKLQKMSRGFFVEIDPATALSDIPARVGGFRNGERRRDQARERVLGTHPELSFVVATLPIEATLPMWGNNYHGSDIVGRNVQAELHNMQLSDNDVMSAMKRYALQQAASGEASEESVAAFIARLSDVEPREIPRRAQF